MEGEGLFKNQVDNMYKGTWKDNRKEGKGTFFWKNGAVYKGDYSQDLKSGNGTLWYSDGLRVFRGEFKGGKLNGNGEMFENGKVTKGTW